MQEKISILSLEKRKKINKTERREKNVMLKN